MYCYIQCPNPVADHHQPMPPLETPGHSRASLGQSLVGSLLLSLGSWCMEGYVQQIKNGLEWVNLTQMTVISTTVGKNPLKEME